MKHSAADIIDAAIGVIATAGPGASMAQIADAAGVSNGTLFHYFPTKQALLDAVYTALKTDFAAATLMSQAASDAEPVEVLRDLWTRWIAWARAHPERHRAVQLLRAAGLVSPEVLASGNESVAAPLAALRRAAKQGRLVALPVDHLAQLLVAQLEFTITSALPEDQIDTAYDLAWRSITRPDITRPDPAPPEES